MIGHLINYVKKNYIDIHNEIKCFDVTCFTNVDKNLEWDTNSNSFIVQGGQIIQYLYRSLLVLYCKYDVYRTWQFSKIIIYVTPNDEIVSKIIYMMP
jgi:hypothetical protein